MELECHKDKRIGANLVKEVASSNPQEAICAVEKAALHKAKREIVEYGGRELSDVTESDTLKNVKEVAGKARDVAEKVVEVAAVAVPGGQGAVVEIAANEVVKTAAKEVGKAVVKEVAKSVTSDVIDATESESLQKVKSTIVEAASKTVDKGVGELPSSQKQLPEVKGMPPSLRLPKYESTEEDGGLGLPEVYERKPGSEVVKEWPSGESHLEKDFRSAGDLMQGVRADNISPAQINGSEIYKESHLASNVRIGRNAFSKEFLENVICMNFRNSDGLLKRLPREGSWEGEEGNSLWIPDESKRSIFEKYGIKGIYFKDGEPDFSLVAVDEVKIEKITCNRGHNFAVARAALAEKWNKEAKDGHTDWTGQKVQEYLRKNKLTLHECGDGKTIQVVPQEIHENTPHSGGVAVAKSEVNNQNGGEDVGNGKDGAAGAVNTEAKSDTATVNS